VEPGVDGLVLEQDRALPPGLRPQSVFLKDLG
jgi:hypothetical protein